jgi:uncharacterized protein YukE
MSAGVSVDYASVLAAAERMAVLADRLVAAPGADALRRLATELPGGALADAAQDEAAQWRRETTEITVALERYAGALQAAVDSYRTLDEGLAR